MAYQIFVDFFKKHNIRGLDFYSCDYDEIYPNYLGLPY